MARGFRDRALRRGAVVLMVAMCGVAAGCASPVMPVPTLALGSESPAESFSPDTPGPSIPTSPTSAPTPSGTTAPSPSPELPSAAVLGPCDPNTLGIIAGRDGATGTVRISIRIANAGAPCSLPALPASVRLLTGAGKPLAVEPIASDEPAAGRIVLATADDAATAGASWVNWCGGATGKLRVSVVLAAGQPPVVGPLIGSLLPRCDGPGHPSTIQLFRTSADAAVGTTTSAVSVGLDVVSANPTWSGAGSMAG